MRLTGMLACLGLLVLISPPASAQTPAWPTAPVRVVMPYPAGGTGDVVTRILAERVAHELGQPVTVENRTGAGGIIGAQAVARARPDGYTLLVMATAHTILERLQKEAPYSLERDFVPVFGITSSPLTFAVQGKSPIRSLADVAATARAAQGGINYTSGGIGTISHLATVRLLQTLGVPGVHIPFRGFSGAIQALLGGQVGMVCVGVADVLEHVRAGDIRLLAVTSEQRLPQHPDTPTMTELGFADFHPASWNAVLAPAATPKEIVERLHAAYARAAADAGVHEKLGKLGVSVRLRSNEEVSSFIRAEATRWQRVIEDNRLKIDL